jgi:hypothetical protein
MKSILQTKHLPFSIFVFITPQLLNFTTFPKFQILTSSVILNLLRYFLYSSRLMLSLKLLLTLDHLPFTLISNTVIIISIFSLSLYCWCKRYNECLYKQYFLENIKSQFTNRNKTKIEGNSWLYQLALMSDFFSRVFRLADILCLFVVIRD